MAILNFLHNFSLLSQPKVHDAIQVQSNQSNSSYDRSRTLLNFRPNLNRQTTGDNNHSTTSRDNDCQKLECREESISSFEVPVKLEIKEEIESEEENLYITKTIETSSCVDLIKDDIDSYSCDDILNSVKTEPEDDSDKRLIESEESQSKEKQYYIVKGPFPYKCKHCHQCFKNRNGDMYRHFRTDHVKQELTCDELKSKLSTLASSHKDEFLFECKFCCKFFNAKHELESQMKQSAAIDGRIYCFHCINSFNSLDDLNEHLKCHSLYNSFIKCTECMIEIKSFLCFAESCGSVVQSFVSQDAQQIEIVGEKKFKKEPVRNLKQRSNVVEQDKIGKAETKIFNWIPVVQLEQLNGRLCSLIPIDNKSLKNKSETNTDDSIYDCAENRGIQEMVDNNETSKENNGLESFMASWVSLDLHENKEYAVILRNDENKRDRNQSNEFFQIRHQLKENIYKCNKCSQDLRSEEKFKAHDALFHEGKKYDIVNGIDPFKCVCCGKCFKLQTSIYKHFRNFHLQREEFWITQNAETLNSGDKRYRVVKGPRPFQCAACSKCFPNKDYVTRHYKQFHGEMRFKCKHCGKGFCHQNPLTSHLLTHKRELSFQCNVCHKAFRRRQNVRVHMRNVHVVGRGRPYICGECGKSFKSRDNLKCHLRCHSVDRPTVTCMICNKKLGSTTALKGHLTLHTGEKEMKFQCEVCNKGFRQNVNYKTHLRIHTGEKPYGCPHCPRHFNTSPSLQIHIRTHTGERPFVCNVCGKDFPKKENLRGHLRSHTGEKPYVCPYCGKAFALYSNSVTHRRKCKAKKSERKRK